MILRKNRKVDLNDTQFKEQKEFQFQETDFKKGDKKAKMTKNKDNFNS